MPRTPRLRPDPPYVKIGEQAIDTVSQFSGTIVGYAKYISGREQFLIQRAVGADEAFVSAKWFDLARVELLS